MEIVGLIVGVVLAETAVTGFHGLNSCLCNQAVRRSILVFIY